MSLTSYSKVVYGGRLDVDVEIKENNRALWSVQRQQTGEHSFTAEAVSATSAEYSDAEMANNLPITDGRVLFLL
jgi:outer membrane protein assembly factor BamA